MGSITLHAQGAADAAEVWARYADTRRWPQWSPQIRRVEADPRLAAGLTGVVHSWLGVRVPFSVIAVDADAWTWSWQVSLGPVRLRLEHGVRISGEGSETWLTMRGPSPIILGYAPVAGLALRRLVKAG